MALPDSLYRARILEDEPPTASDESKPDKPTVLPWLGWDSKTMVAVEVRNMMNAVITAKYGGKNAKPHPLLPPGADKEPPRRENEGTVENFEHMFAKFHMT